MTSLMFFVAQADAPAVSASGLGSLMGSPVVFFVMIFAMFYFMIIRPQNRKEKERKKMITDLKTGAKVVFGSGMLGTVTNVKENTFVVKIADNVKVEVLRESVAKVLEKDEKPGDEKRSK
jgi:preprotein translocase subunit YajC